MVGNIANFRNFDILRAFLHINKGVSRAELSKKLWLGEGTVRSILNILKNKKLIDSTKKGHALTEKGKRLLKKIKLKISMPKKVNLSFYSNKKQVALLIRDSKDINCVKERDLAVKNGADSALILMFNKKLEMPGCECDFNSDEFEDLFDYKEKDILVVTAADSYKNAETSALAVAVDLAGWHETFLKNT